MEQKNVCVRINPYTNRVLGVIKERYGLNDKGEAIDRFAELYGDEFVEKDIKEEIVAEMIDISKRHRDKHGIRKIKDSELDKLFGK